ncbi:MAG: M23 family metallopeptidase [Rhodospirillaceae bacterium]|nr:M23 family metallopeptidase [Rhodospirillaceae bacterium]
MSVRERIAGTMFLKGSLVAIVLAISVLLSAKFVFETDRQASADTTVTLSMAPISIGNPAAAATLTLRRTEYPRKFTAKMAATNYSQILTVGRGDTLGRMLLNAGVPGAEADAAIRALKKDYNPTRIRQGENIVIRFRADPKLLGDDGTTDPGVFSGLQISPDFKSRVIVSRNSAGGFDSTKEKLTLTRRMARANNTIEQSLFVAGRKVDVPNPVLGELIRLYSWDVDFQRDIRVGDAFEVMYEKIYNQQGDLVKSGDIVFASLTLSDKRYAVYRHTLDDGTAEYFDEKGHSTKKALMRTPIDGARLSSGFGKRKHPVLGYTKMHKGLDFAAPRGTPIYAAGNGTVEAAGRNGAYGNYVRIRHNSEYSTAYAHMKSVKTKKGRRVTQGQVIGYVGTTGRSTGPHLHYEILLSGRQVNPMRVKMPSGRKLKGAELTAFQKTRTLIERQFAALAGPLDLAENTR